MIGKKISPILLELEAAIVEFDCTINEKPNYTEDALRASGKILLSVVMDKMWDMQEQDKMSQEDRLKMAQSCGEELRKLFKTYCNVDTHDFYKETIIGHDYIISRTVKWTNQAKRS